MASDKALADWMSQQQDRHFGRDLLGHIASIEVIVMEPDLWQFRNPVLLWIRRMAVAISPALPSCSAPARTKGSL